MQTIRNVSLLVRYLLISLLLLGTGVNPAFAEAIDRIQINQAGDEAEIKIFFVTRIQFVRQVMLKNGDVRIYFNLLEIDSTDPRLVGQRRESPPSSIAPRFTVTYPEIDSALTISFGKAVDYHIRPGNDGRSISFFTPIIKKVSGSLPKVSSSTPATKQTEDEAQKLMAKAKNVLSSKSYRATIALLNKLLSLPANQQSQFAQYLIGQVYERNGEFVNAREAYLAYVKNYPMANNLKEVQARLAQMIMTVYKAEKSMPEGLAINDNMTYYGGFSQYYSKGLLHVDSTALPTAVVTTTNISNQSQLLSSIELTGQKRTESTESRLVLRDTYSTNFIDGVGNTNFLQAAYLERGPIDQHYLYGLGRKIGAAGGLPNRFDGAWLNRNLDGAWRVNGSIGTPVASPGNNDETKTFGAVSVDFNSTGGKWSGNTYFIGQRVTNIMDRRAAGLEAHYFDAYSNHMGLFEYDTLFKKLNIGLIQGNWTAENGANYTLLLDQRRHLAITNALLLDPPTQSIEGLLQTGATTASLHDKALLTSPIYNQFMIGTTQPYSPGVKIGGDFRTTNATSYQAYDPLLIANTVFPRVWAYIYSAQVIGTNLLFNNDLGIASVSYTNASTYNAKTLSFSQLATFRDNWQLNISLQLYNEHKNSGGSISRINPSFRLNYRMSQTLNFEAGAGLALTNTRNSASNDKTRGRYFNLGYRWDF